MRLRAPAAADALAGQLAGAAKGVDRRAVAEDVARVLEAAALAVALRRERADQPGAAAGAPREGRCPEPGAGARAGAVRPQPRHAGRHAGGGRARRGARLMAKAPARGGQTQGGTTLEQLLAAKEIVVTCGSGGVGKTTTAAALATMAAIHLGGRVLVLTVDPARRLADALGLEAWATSSGGCRRRRSPRPGSSREASCGPPCSTPRQSWDDLIRRHAPDARTRDAILANPLYENITGRFVQSHDYIAMERLHELHTSGRYDLIVVDTPPTPQRPRLPRRAGTHGGVLRQPAPALADRTDAQPGRERRRPGPSSTWPTASSAPSSSRTSPSSSCCSSRWRRASSAGPAPSAGSWRTTGARSAWSRPWRRRRRRRRRSSWRRCTGAASAWAR